MDPLIDEYPELTNYQYANNEPIGNVDIDGLEGGIATVVDLGHGVWNTIIAPAAKVAQTASVGGGIAKGLQNALTMSSIVLKGANYAISHLDGNNPGPKAPQQLTNAKHLSKEPGSKGGLFEFGYGNSMEENNRNPKGTGGIGTVDNKEILEGFFGFKEGFEPSDSKFLNYWKGANSLYDAREKGISVIENDESNTENTTPKKYKSSQGTGIDPMFNKKNNRIYHRDNGSTTIVNGDGTQSLTKKRAIDTFPPTKIIPGYAYPLDPK